MAAARSEAPGEAADGPTRSRTVVLCYHAISEDWPAVLAVSQQALRDHVHGFLRRGFEPHTFGDAIVRPTGRKTLAVTFDDAFRSVVEGAFPVLADLGVPATVFVPTAHAGDGSPMSWPGIDQWVGTSWEAELAGASWDELRRLAEAGWEIGSHTRSHPRLTQIQAEQLRIELEGSREDCERELDRPCVSIAYPYGDVDTRVVAAAREAGYLAGASLPERLEGGPTAPDRLCWPRAGAYRADGTLKVRTKATLLRRAPRLWAAAQDMRRRARALTDRRR
jgi:peptidoglycan/xylan/chitin deacetylase (PgdA/CDA1 family)